MAKINLLKQEWTEKSRLVRLRLVVRGLIFITAGGFLVQTFYIAGRLVYTRSKINRVKNEIEAANSVFVGNKELVEDYVWAQGVLAKIGLEKKNEYKYKDYLREINGWLTKGTSLAGASFTKKDEISILVFTEGVDDYRDFETRLKMAQKEKGFGFKAVEQEWLSRLEDGTYKVKIRLKI